jgi:hypothetical protein
MISTLHEIKHHHHSLKAQLLVYKRSFKRVSSTKTQHLKWRKHTGSYPLFHICESFSKSPEVILIIYRLVFLTYKCHLYMFVAQSIYRSYLAVKIKSTDVDALTYADLGIPNPILLITRHNTLRLVSCI